MKRWLGMLLACVALLSMAGCGRGSQDMDFYSFVHQNGGVLRVGQTRTEQRVVCPNTPGDMGVDVKYEGDDYVATSMLNKGRLFTTVIGNLGLDSTLADVLPAYAKIQGVTVLENGPNRIILEKTINGAQYTATFVAYDDGTLRCVTLTNQDTCTNEKTDFGAAFGPMDGVTGGGQ